MNEKRRALVYREIEGCSSLCSNFREPSSVDDKALCEMDEGWYVILLRKGESFPSFCPLERVKGKKVRRVTVNEQVNFGKPSVGGIPVEVLVDRFCAGESVMDLVLDYNLSDGQIEEALRWQLKRRAM